MQGRNAESRDLALIIVCAIRTLAVASRDARRSSKYGGRGHRLPRYPATITVAETRVAAIVSGPLLNWLVASQAAI